MKIFKLVCVSVLLILILNGSAIVKTKTFEKADDNAQNWEPKCPQDGKNPIWIMLQGKRDFLDDVKNLVAIRSGKIYYCSGEAIGNVDLHNVQDVSLVAPANDGRHVKQTDQSTTLNYKCPGDGRISIWLWEHGRKDFHPGELKWVSIKSGSLYYCSSQAIGSLKLDDIKEISFTGPQTYLPTPTPSKNLDDKEAEIFSSLQLTHPDVEGKVHLDVELRANRTIGQIEVRHRDDSRLEKDAIDAAKQIKFAPEIRGGKPTDVKKFVTFIFTKTGFNTQNRIPTAISPKLRTPVDRRVSTFLKWNPVPDINVYLLTVDYSSNETSWTNEINQRVVNCNSTSCQFELYYLGDHVKSVRWRVDAHAKYGGNIDKGVPNSFIYK